MTVILDTNVFISAVISASGPSAALLRAARDGRLDVTVSPLLLSELQDVLRRQRFRRFLSLTEVDELLEEVAGACHVEQDPKAGPPLLRDPKDDYLVYLARHVDATHIVSGDADLTDEELEPPAVSPRQAVEILQLG